MCIAAVPRKLDEILSWEEERVVQRDWTVACGGGGISWTGNTNR